MEEATLPALRQGRPTAPAKATGQDTGHTEAPRQPITERPGRASAGQVEEIEAELTRAGIVGNARASLLSRYDVRDPADLFPAQADALLIELRDLASGQSG